MTSGTTDLGAGLFQRRDGHITRVGGHVGHADGGRIHARPADQPFAGLEDEAPAVEFLVAAGAQADLAALLVIGEDVDGVVVECVVHKRDDLAEQAGQRLHSGDLTADFVDDPKLAGPLARLGEKLGIADSARRLVGEHGQKAQVFIAESIRLFALHGDEAQHFAACDQRRKERRTRRVDRVVTGAGGQQIPFFAKIGHTEALGRLAHPADQSAVAALAKAAVWQAFAIAHPDFDDIGVAVEQAKLEVARIDDAAGLLVDDLAQRLQSKLRAEDRAAQLRQSDPDQRQRATGPE